MCFFFKLANVNVTTLSKYCELMKSIFSMTVFSGTSVQYVTTVHRTVCEEWILTIPNSLSGWVVFGPNARVNSPLW